MRNLAGAVGLQLAMVVSGSLGARILGPTNRGYLAILATWPSTVCQIGAVGMSLAATYYLAAGRTSARELVSLLRSSVAIQVVALSLVNAAIVISYTIISGAPILFAALVSLAQVPAGLAVDYGLALALGARHHGFFSGVRAVPAVTNAIGLIYLFVVGPRTINAVIAVLTASSVAAGCVALVGGLRRAKTVVPNSYLQDTLSRADAKNEVLAFGRRGYVGYLSPTDSFRVDQLVVGLLLSPRILGMYAVAATFTTFVRVVAQNVGLSSTAEIASCSDIDARQRAVSHSMDVTAVLVAAITLTIGVGVVPAIPLLFGHAFAASLPIAECLLVASGLLSIKRVAVDLMRGANELQIGTRTEVIILAIFLGSCVPAGLWGGGVAVAASMALAALCGTVYLTWAMRQIGFWGRSR